jgi:hypothetical protein
MSLYHAAAGVNSTGIATPIRANTLAFVLFGHNNLMHTMRSTRRERISMLGGNLNAWSNPNPSLSCAQIFLTVCLKNKTGILHSRFF